MPQTKSPRQPIQNNLLASLSPQEYRRLKPDLEETTLTLGEILYEPDTTVKYVYFPNSGIVSLISTVEERSTLEVGLVGKEGMVGIECFLGAKKSITRALVQGTGTAMRMKVKVLHREIDNHMPLSELLRRYTYFWLLQLSQGMVCNRFHHVEKRLARWLLITQDRLELAEFKFTQDFLSDMLGVRREGVVIAARALQHLELISYVRGRLKILSRRGLEMAACQCYETLRLNYHI